MLKVIKKILPLLFLSAFCFAQPPDLYPFQNQADSLRFQNLITAVRCVVCQNQNIADSTAPLANDLREKIYQMVLAQKSNAEIKSFLVKRYGEFILLQPTLTRYTLGLWALPMIVLIIGMTFLLSFIYRKPAA